WISNAGYADLGLVLARNIVAGRDDGTNAFVIESNLPNADDSKRPGVQCIRLEEKMGIHASATGVLELNVRVPKENLVGTVGKGYRHVLERLVGMRMGVSFQACGVAERAYQLAKEYANERQQFNKPIGIFPAIARKLRGMEIELTRMRRLSFEGAYALSRNQRQMGITPDHLQLDEDGKKTLEQFQQIYTAGILNYAISRAKMYNSEVGWMVVDDALQIFGGNGFSREYDVERLLRDFRVLRIYEGTSEIQEYILDRTKDVAKARNLETLTQIARTQGRGGTKPVEPEFTPMDYQNVFFLRFPNSKDAFVEEGNQEIFLFKN
ncbi:MAG TPA: acyl-CoA dehydrogenase, partial [Candidatus Hodarchaeales archaeon]|nr:acyl-CoA dehydrogenase [Candidatus Hodarchaeales archaeon]